ncbi:MAG: pilin [Candidatus Kuenenbacteria bacterium]
MKKTIFFLLILFIFLISLVPIAQADTNLTDPLGLNTNAPVEDLAIRIIKVILGLVGVITMGMFIYGGLMWMTSGGREEKVKKGRQILIWTILGLVIILTSYVILTFFINSLDKSTG